MLDVHEAPSCRGGHEDMIDLFSHEHAFLSNFHDSPVLFDGETYPTVEHAYQAAKTTDPAERRKIREARSAGLAKRLGKKLQLRSGWNDMRVGVMLDLLREKFSDPIMRQQLLDTGDAELVEGNGWGDQFWGVDDRTGRGKNMLGKLLMQVRMELS
jgi:ribA/ribD-fused uncharacterized protein